MDVDVGEMPICRFDIFYLNNFGMGIIVMLHQACESRDYQVGNGSLTGNNSGRTIGGNHYLCEGL